MSGSIFYRGPSQLDGAPIVGIAIVSSSNRKTGNMVQTYIIRSDVHPLDALASGADASVCGDCKHRPISGGACYVNVGQGVASVYGAFTRGRYPDSLASAAAACNGRMLRLGTYGDPMAIPAPVWQALASSAAGRTGYTHQWLNADVSDSQRTEISHLCMASADTETEAEMAHSIGLRTFRVRRPTDAVLPGEFVCPASEEAGKRKTCATCGACDGTRENRGASAVIIAHGSLASRFIRIEALA
jgi:hypothetical protein